MVPAPMLVLLADTRVADVGQVWHLGPVGDAGVLDLHERADLALRAERVPGRRYANGPTLASAPMTDRSRAYA